MPECVIGTAGHIDHGKSTLVHRLTGVDPDRLAAEKIRGMSIELGFARLTLPSGRETSIVDVPGHERFVATMVAGAAGIDLALLVVAADEGIMPQTREHVGILDLLGVRSAVVALTRTDLVDAEWQALVGEEVEDFVAGTCLRGSAVVPVSAVTGNGVEDLLHALEAALERLETNVGGDFPYLPVDRVFTLAGFGTIVTGTLHGGEVRTGDEMEILPSCKRARVRRLQCHNQDVAEATAGTRVAMNLVSESRASIRRGDVLAPVGRIQPAQRFDARVRVVANAEMPLRSGIRVALHAGSAAHAATVKLLGERALDAGQTGWARVSADSPIPLVYGQRFILRLPSPAGTIGGGEVLDLQPRRRASPRTFARLQALADHDPAVRCLGFLSDGQARTAREVAEAIGSGAGDVIGLLERSRAGGAVVRLNQSYLHRDAWQQLSERCASLLSDYAHRHPMGAGMPREELRRRLGINAADWPSAVRLLREAGVVVEVDTAIALPGDRGGTAGQAEMRERVLAALATSPYSPPDGKELLTIAQAEVALLEAMVREGDIVRVAAGRYLAREAYDHVVRVVLEAIDQRGHITVGELRDQLGTSRKYALGLLEYLDGEHITARREDIRVRGSRAPACA